MGEAVHGSEDNHHINVSASQVVVPCESDNRSHLKRLRSCDHHWIRALTLRAPGKTEVVQRSLPLSMTVILELGDAHPYLFLVMIF
jgi:hypothetical protein